MMTETDWNALAEMCEAADGPDRAVDLSIEEAVNPHYDGIEDGQRAFLIKYGSHPAYTASIDSALTLVFGKDLWCVGDDSEGPFARITPGMPGGSYVGSEQITVCAATPALALLAACCRARGQAASETHHD
jgi:hypothetical protein